MGEALGTSGVKLPEWMLALDVPFHDWELDERWTEIMGKRVWRNVETGETAIQDKDHAAVEQAEA